MSNAGYMDRALRAKDPRFARVLGRLGYSRSDLMSDNVAPVPPVDEDELTRLRNSYKSLTGKVAHWRWTEKTLMAKISEIQG
ncbi:hypothetical protein Q1W73_16515 [Asticcacaulis sp. ZE23SCel15]|uniref:hypothetical protein n=1 Tax=Asticcacaulis sp. ZE23SCel15 TaxID=3059027 RepID=UPI0026603A71|nr:hypothetical protein [Asticcacaulis sp. ZE23SCel15]WKL57247.1 hypothetical protein Q1W73_16515 [Asticcacaulis sp. ZE23SCel15]